MNCDEQEAAAAAEGAGRRRSWLIFLFFKDHTMISQLCHFFMLVK
jgi:phage terminase large subunit-like protein